jgi:hypothetical protein
MEPNQLQLVLNVVTITGVTSFAGYCYLLRKENRKLAAERRPDSESERRDNHQSVPAVIEPATFPVTAIDEDIRQDIRNFAAGRRSGWVENLASSITTRKQEDSGR